MPCPIQILWEGGSCSIDHLPAVSPVPVLPILCSVSAPVSTTCLPLPAWKCLSVFFLPTMPAWEISWRVEYLPAYLIPASWEEFLSPATSLLPPTSPWVPFSHLQSLLL